MLLGTSCLRAAVGDLMSSRDVRINGFHQHFLSHPVDSRLADVQLSDQLSFSVIKD